METLGQILLEDSAIFLFIYYYFFMYIELCCIWYS